MRVLLDNNVNRRFGALLLGHDVTHVQDIGWENLQNGDLIAAAEADGYGVLVTADKGMQYQQNLKGCRISIIILNRARITLEQIAPLAPRVLTVLETASAGSFYVVGLD